eukprot:TRINITY_DN63574_c0_g1_i1.p1 TRINITY_DN63574_c0_g1~~TRINITY_DN63574_c0_g1_i1.p1  ORF type:complete len:585 (-),score=54.51 TRINITY_DN63574_c0_g1_i1:706-2460(-)
MAFLSLMSAFMLLGITPKMSSATGLVSSPTSGSGVKSSRVLLSVATRNRLWTHSLSTISLLQAIDRARSEFEIEWHILDAASSGTESVTKQKILKDLVYRGLVQNYTQLPEQVGTISLLRQFVDIVLQRQEFGYWLHVDDDVLMGRDALLLALRDYRQDFRYSADAPKNRGGLLAIFVNSWLDEQLHRGSPAFGPYAVVPFLGGASYVIDRATLAATGNPWAKALEANNSVSPHDAHVLWLQRLLPRSGHHIWVRWDRPYECQHLANVDTLNFGRQPGWEPMWAINHITKRIVEVTGYRSVDLRAALWAGGEALEDFIRAQNSKALTRLRLKLPGHDKSSARAKREWSIWNYPRRHAHYVEIGTSDFDTLVQRHTYRSDIVGLSVEPVKAYFDELQSLASENKTLLNAAVGDYDGFEDVFLVRPELIDKYMGSKSFCDAKALRSVGLEKCLPGWLRGTSAVKAPQKALREYFGEKIVGAIVATRVPVVTYASLLTIYGFGSVDTLKIDTEGFDHIILRDALAFAEARNSWPRQIQFEKNAISDWRALDELVKRMQDKLNYRCRMIGPESVACWRGNDAMSTNAR